MSSIVFALPTVDFGLYFENNTSPEAIRECEKAADGLRDYGAILVKDPRVTKEDNDRFLDMMEDYYAQSHEVKMRDARPDVGYQVGVTPEFTEEARCIRDPKCHQIIDEMTEENRPVRPTGPDPKWRFMWPIEKLSVETKYARLHATPVIPEAFKDTWTDVMDKWGGQMHRAAITVLEMFAIGFGMAPNTIRDMAVGGAHLLAPTGSDLEKHGKIGSILAAFHYDLNLISVHGKSRYPGLYIWPRNENDRILVQVPDGYLLVQAGKQLEWLTGGEILAGYHEVVVTKETLKAVETARVTRPDRPLWRISSTFFFHLSTEATLQPLEPFPKDDNRYPPICVGEYVSNELSHIKLIKDEPIGYAN
ncbi:21_t:CDS:2 [Paraglomus brasilianum]|uniref:21_t:CDS:1 n=1 Tax=Paraglomus brasilianum TaxID=144538 RepID=A0A9N9BAM7_9GLOM|nr:21_t:CDS:2 [Paraglomus brasilianum]